MRFRHIAALVAVALLVALPVAAQETTGAITGAVRGQDGALLPGATVVVTGPIGNVQAVSDERGEFRFPRLPSGRYTVKASLSGFATGESAVDLTVGSTGRVEFTLGLATVTETVNVVGESSAMDITSSSTTTNISRERIDLIPRGRDFTDVVAQAAGAANESQAGGISIDGSSGSENRFVIDGIDTTDPQDGTSAVPLRADFLEEVQVKSAGYAAEYGGSTGGVINVITKSGANAWHGGVLAQYEQRSWGGDVRPILRDDLDQQHVHRTSTPRRTTSGGWTPGFFLSGPILKDRLWFFGSYQPGIRSTERTVTFTNGVTEHLPAGLHGQLRDGEHHRQHRLQAAVPRRRQLLALLDREDPARPGPGAPASPRPTSTCAASTGSGTRSPARSTGPRPTASWSRRASAATAPTARAPASRSPA